MGSGDEEGDLISFFLWTWQCLCRWYGRDGRRAGDLSRYPSYEFSIAFVIESPSTNVRAVRHGTSGRELRSGDSATDKRICCKGASGKNPIWCRSRVLEARALQYSPSLEASIRCRVSRHGLCAAASGPTYKVHTRECFQIRTSLSYSRCHKQGELVMRIRPTDRANHKESTGAGSEAAQSGLLYRVVAQHWLELGVDVRWGTRKVLCIVGLGRRAVSARAYVCFRHGRFLHSMLK